MRLPGHRNTAQGIPTSLVPELARVLRRRWRQLDLSLAAVSAAVGVDEGRLSRALNPHAAHPLWPAEYGRLGDALILLPSDEFDRRQAETGPAAACRFLAVLARATLAAAEAAPRSVQRIPSDGELLSLEREAITLANEGFPHEALSRLSNLLGLATAANNRQACWAIKLHQAQVLLMLSLLEEAEANCASVEWEAGEAGDIRVATFAAILRANTLYELGGYQEAHQSLNLASRGLESEAPLREVLSTGPMATRRVHLLHPRDTVLPREYLWWFILRLRAKIRVEQCLVAAPDRAAIAEARAVAAASFDLGRRLDATGFAQDQLWLARSYLLDGSADGWREAGRHLDQARPRLAGGTAAGYHRRATGMRMAAGDAPGSEHRALSCLLQAADMFCAYGDARGLGPTYSEAAVQSALLAHRASGVGKAREAQALSFRLALAAAAMHPYGVVRHQLVELLESPLVTGRLLNERRMDVEDLLDFRKEPFAPLRDLAHRLWANDPSQVFRRRLLRIAPIARLLP